MVTVLKSCDIAVSRAGSLSISELLASGVATIYVPYPYAAADHQRKNARFMEENGAGLYLEDADVCPQKLLELLVLLIQDPSRLYQIQQSAYKMAKLDSVASIVQQIKNVL